VRGIINSASREDLQNTMHLDNKIAEAIITTIDYAIDEHPHVVVDGIRQASIVEKVLQHYPNAELVWLEVPVEERKRRYQARKDAKDVEAFEIADNKPIELECQNIFSIFKEQLRIINN
jgi:cytidylate kinase